jgi:large subunit ribosomal protein L5
MQSRNLIKNMLKIQEKYNKEAVSEIRKKFKLKNNLEAPRIQKVVINVGVGKFLKDSSQVEEIVKWVTAIAGQKPVMTSARQSIAGFKIRQGLAVGVKVTLRGQRMWSFIEKLVNVTIPRIRDFRGLKLSSVDGDGNLNIGMKEQLIFSEILPEQVKTIFGLEITIVTNVRNRENGLELFKLLGFPMESVEGNNK